ncbi:hypothetical protein Ahy_A03g014596 [Arachis hypogaea]|uniref:Aminotransferase-like plant mobile domain-containing protein n=1 Tax=Arachis hypogaea TaxID=3818 RepID=A0A445DY65_ARAHY|nr:hypothetical protein Ahy_A03g014596 [Arachis hypogaea]
MNLPDSYTPIIESLLWATGFYHVSQVRVIQGQSTLVIILVERCHPNTHTFHLPTGECAITLEDIALILGIPINGLRVTGTIMTSQQAIEAKCLHQFGVAPKISDCRESYIKMTWIRNVKDGLYLKDRVAIEKYVKFHILLFGSILFVEKSGSTFVWEAYVVYRIEPDAIPKDICHHAIVPLMSFESLERHSTDSHVLIEEHVPLHHLLDLYMYRYRGKYGTHLYLSDLLLHENQEGDAVPNQPRHPEPQPSLQS